MKKILLVILVIIAFLSFYYWKLKNAFKIQITAISDLQIDESGGSIHIDLEISNKLMPEFVADYLNLQISINGQYIGNIITDDLMYSEEGKLLISSTFIFDDVNILVEKMIEPDKKIEISGSLDIIKPFDISVPIAYSEVL